MKLSKRLTHNLALKIVSFLFAVALWLVVMNIDDPVKHDTFTDVPVVIKNADEITDRNMLYDTLDNSDIVSRVTVYAPGSVLQKIDKTDIVAEADFNNLTQVNTLPITFSVPRYDRDITSITGSSDSVKVSIENKKSIQLVLNTTVSGKAPDGYMVGNVSTDQNLVRVSGPESIVNRVKKAQVNIDVTSLSGVTNDISTGAPVRLLDADENEVTGVTLSKYPDSVIVSLEILSTKKVPLILDVTGAPADGYARTGKVVSSLEEVEIAGKKNVINNVTEILIPGDALDVTGDREDAEILLNIKNYLPDNTILADKNFDGRFSVTIGIEGQTTETFAMDLTDTKILNVPQGLKCSLDGLSNEQSIKVTGIRSAMDGFTKENITCFFDMQKWLEGRGDEGIAPGTYSVELDFNLPDNTSLDSPVVADLVIEKEGE